MIFAAVGGWTGLTYLLASIFAVSSGIGAWYRKMKKDVEKMREKRKEKLRKRELRRRS